MKEQLEQKEVDYSRGKTAGHDVRDRDGNLIVARGQQITDDMIDRARTGGMLHYLMLAAAASVIQVGGDEARRRLQEFRDITEGHESDLVRGETAARDVADFGGNVIVRAGDVVTDGVIENVRKQGRLQELVLAVAAPGVHVDEEEEEHAGEEAPAAKMGYTPFSH